MSSAPTLLLREVLRKAGVRGVVEPEGELLGSSKRERAAVEVLDMKEGAWGETSDPGGEESGMEEERVVMGRAAVTEMLRVEADEERGASLAGEAARKSVGRPAEKAIEMGRRDSAGALAFRMR